MASFPSMPTNAQRTARRGVFTNGVSFYVNTPKPEGGYRWKRFATYEEAVRFQDQRVPIRPKPKWKAATAVPDRPGWVYFMAPVGGGLVKIGFASRSVEDRLAKLQIGSPVRLEVIGRRRGFKEDEARLHERFAAIRHHGEWFEPTPEVLREAGLTDDEAELDERAHWRAAADRLREMRSSLVA